jgi:hypothetical protein
MMTEVVRAKWRKVRSGIGGSPARGPGLRAGGPPLGGGRVVAGAPGDGRCWLGGDVAGSQRGAVCGDVRWEGFCVEGRGGGTASQ